MVTKKGFPIAYEVFSGNTLKGHTIISVVKEFISKHNIISFTVVADAAMISSANVEEVITKQNKLHCGSEIG